MQNVPELLVFFSICCSFLCIRDQLIICVFNGSCWHEISTAQKIGKRICVRFSSSFAYLRCKIDDSFYSTGVNDAPISELALSTRSYNGLFRNKIYRVSQLIGMLIDDLFAMKNLGKKSADEIFEKLNKYLMLHSLPINGGVAQIDGDDEKETPSIIQIEYTHNSVMSVFIGHEIEILSKKQIIDALPNSKRGSC